MHAIVHMHFQLSKRYCINAHSEVLRTRGWQKHLRRVVGLGKAVLQKNSEWSAFRL